MAKTVHAAAASAHAPMQNVNLLDRRLLPAEPALRSATVLAALGAAAVLVAAHGAVEQHLTQRAFAGAHAAEAGAGESGSDSTGSGGEPEAAVPLTPEQRALRQQIAVREALLAALEREVELPPEPASTLRSVVAALPPTMWLTEVDLAGARDLRISGGTLEPQALGEFARRLGEAQALRGVGLQTVRLEPVMAEGTNPAAEPAAAALSGPAADQPEQPAATLPLHTFVLASQGTAGGGR